jgi:hypothetical protein
MGETADVSQRRLAMRRSGTACACTRWGLPCLDCRQSSGALLPHRFTLAEKAVSKPQPATGSMIAERKRLTASSAVCSLWHFPWLDEGFHSYSCEWRPKAGGCYPSPCPDHNSISIELRRAPFPKLGEWEPLLVFGLSSTGTRVYTPRCRAAIVCPHTSIARHSPSRDVLVTGACVSRKRSRPPRGCGGSAHTESVTL